MAPVPPPLGISLSLADQKSAIESDPLDAIDNYYQPDGTSAYLRPDGTSYYKRP